MKVQCHLPMAALLVGLLLSHQAAGQTVEHIFFDTTGDFGVDENWSDPTKAPQANVAADPLHIYYINGDRTATISHDSPNGSHFEVKNLFIGDSPPGQEPHTAGTLIMEGGPAPAPGEFGASLVASELHQFRLGRSVGDGGTMIMNGTSDLLAPGLIVGDRSRGELYIGPDARVRAFTDNGDGTFNRTDIRIGTFGPVFGGGVDANGLIEVAGTLSGNTVYMPQDDGDAVLRILPGAVVNVSGIDMAFHAFQPNRSSLLEIIGSGGSITTTVGSVQAAHPTATIKFTADAGGVTPIVSVGITDPPLPPGGADVENGNLVLDLDDFNFTPSSTMMLVDVAPDSLFGPFGTVTFLGDTTATVNYDFANGDIFLSDFVSTAPPGVIGDFNDDGTVDAADYVVWRKHNGTTTVLPNDNTPGIVSPADYDDWVANFGMMSGGGAGVTAVPEPASLSAALLLMACCATARGLLRK